MFPLKEIKEADETDKELKECPLKGHHHPP
jgi:hypothetical protein